MWIPSEIWISMNFVSNLLVNKIYTSESVMGIFPICTYEGFIPWWSFRPVAIILSELWIIIQWQTDRRTDWQTDRKWCIWAHRATCTGRLQKKGGSSADPPPAPSFFPSANPPPLFFSGWGGGSPPSDIFNGIALTVWYNKCLKELHRFHHRHISSYRSMVSYFSQFFFFCKKCLLRCFLLALPKS